MLTLVANGLVFSGLFVLIGALFPVRTLIHQLPSDPVRRKWILQSVLIVVFILGYLGYAAAFWRHPPSLTDLIVPGVFFFGATFVWMTISLSLQTALDVRPVTLLEQESITDPLIGIYNRRYLDRRLAEEYQRAHRYRLPLSLLLIDIDHFKRVNDSYGHPVGDRVLRYWGDLILSIVRASDIVARYGGEEILVIAPNTSLATAAALAERLQANIESHELTVSSERGQRQVIRITVSIGVAGLSPTVESGEKLLAEADRALYQAKRTGRNRVVRAGESQGETQPALMEGARPPNPEQ
jgi:diguanylate cyclase (GGDEF)-like protein